MQMIKKIISVASFTAAIVIGFCALFIPPLGIIDSSVLWFVAQLLVFTSSLLGTNFSVDTLSKIVKTNTKEDSQK